MAALKHEERVEIRVPTEDLDRWKASADAKRMTLSAWIRYVCNDTAIDQETLDAVERLKRERAAKKGRR